VTDCLGWVEPKCNWVNVKCLKCSLQHQQKNVHRTNSHDHVRKLVEQEGRAARNLVTWSVPVTDPNEDGENIFMLIFLVVVACILTLIKIIIMVKLFLVLCNNS